MSWLGGSGSGETVKRLDGSNVRDKTVAVATVAAQNGHDNNEMTATRAAQAWLVIIQRQQRDNSDCGGNGGGANLAWIGFMEAARRLDGIKIRDETAAVATAAVRTGLGGNGNK